MKAGERARLLKLRRRVGLHEAPYIVQEQLGGTYEDALSLLVESAINKSFPADLIPKINRWNGGIIGPVEPSESTVATADLLVWLATLSDVAPEDSDSERQADPAQTGDDAKITDIAPSAVLMPVQRNSESDESDLHALFDGVRYEALNKMFSGAGDWKGFAERAARNGLAKAARTDRGLFNPMRAALWWLDSKNPPQWDMARVYRTLANNLPARSSHLKHLLTGSYD